MILPGKVPQKVIINDSYVTFSCNPPCNKPNWNNIIQSSCLLHKWITEAKYKFILIWILLRLSFLFCMKF